MLIGMLRRHGPMTATQCAAALAETVPNCSFHLRQLAEGSRPIGALLGGALGQVIGVRAALGIGAVGAVAGVLFVLVSPIPRMRDLPDA